MSYPAVFGNQPWAKVSMTVSNVALKGGVPDATSRPGAAIRDAFTLVARAVLHQ